MEGILMLIDTLTIECLNDIASKQARKRSKLRTKINSLTKELNGKYLPEAEIVYLEQERSRLKSRIVRNTRRETTLMKQLLVKHANH